jgi:transposase
MAHNFIACDREQAFLLPPSLREWLPEDHLAWFVIEAVETMDLGEFYPITARTATAAPPMSPRMMVALLLYAYATKQRSARGVERHCRPDVAYRVICANRVPDHATIARFVDRHEATSSRWSTRPPASYGERASPSSPRWRWRTPATGTTSRWTASPPMASRS